MDKQLIKFAIKGYVFMTIILLCLGLLAWVTEKLG